MLVRAEKERVEKRPWFLVTLKSLCFIHFHPWSLIQNWGDHQSGVAAVGTSCEAGGWCIPSEHLDVFPANQHNSEYIQDQSHNNWFSLQKFHLYPWICLIMVRGFLVFRIFRYFIDWRGWGHRRLSCRGTAWGEWASVWVHGPCLKFKILKRKLRATWRKVASCCWSMPN